MDVRVRVNAGVSSFNADVSVNCIAPRFIPPTHEEQELVIVILPATVVYQEYTEAVIELESEAISG